MKGIGISGIGMFFPSQYAYVHSGDISLFDLILSYDPIAYWPMNETTGINADNAEGTASRDGTYSAGVVLNNAVGPDDNYYAPLFTADDQLNVASDSLDSAFNIVDGTVSAWFKVTDAGAWTDSTSRAIVYFAQSTVNRIVIYKLNTNNTLYFEQRANSVSLSTTTTVAGGRTDWVHVALAWNSNGEEVKAYVDGVQVGATKVGLGTYGAVNFGSTTTYIGEAWNGWIAHFAVWDRQLTDNEIYSLYTGVPLAHPADRFRIPIDSADVDSNGHIYAGRRSRVLKSIDGGATWVLIKAVAGGPTFIPRVFVDSRDYIYYSGGGGSSDWGLFRSTDGGANFTSVLELDEDCNIWGIDEDSSGNLYAGEYSIGGAGKMQIWKSTDDGETWVQKYINDLGVGSQDHIHDLRVDPSNDYIYATLGDPTADTLLRSVDAGENWVVISTGGTQLLAIAFLDGWVYVGTDASSDNKIYRFQDAGGASVVLSEVLDLPVDEDVALFAAGETATKVFFLGYKEAKTKDAKIHTYNGVSWETPYSVSSTVTNKGFFSVSRHSAGGVYYVGCDAGATATYGLKFTP